MFLLGLLGFVLLQGMKKYACIHCLAGHSLVSNIYDSTFTFNVEETFAVRIVCVKMVQLPQSIVLASKYTVETTYITRHGILQPK